MLRTPLPRTVRWVKTQGNRDTVVRRPIARMIDIIIMITGATVTLVVPKRNRRVVIATATGIIRDIDRTNADGATTGTEAVIIATKVTTETATGSTNAIITTVIDGINGADNSCLSVCSSAGSLHAF